MSISSLKPPVDLNFKRISFVSGVSTVMSAISFNTKEMVLFIVVSYDFVTSIKTTSQSNMMESNSSDFI